MFDFGFTELLLCGVIALVVLGPEKLPAVARAIGRWTGQAKGYVRSLNAELDRELKLRELREQVSAASKVAQDQVSSVTSSIDEMTQLADPKEATAKQDEKNV